MSFELGDKVKLRSGGPVMTVSKPGRLIIDGIPVGRIEPGRVFCKWFNEKGSLEKRFFDQGELELYKPKKEQKRDIGYK